MNHDRLFLADLAHHGWDEARVMATSPLRGTLALISYLVEQVQVHGGIAAVAYSIIVEWNSARFSKQAVDRAEQEFGKDHVKGARAHLHIDANEDHVAEMFEIAYLLSGHPEGLRLLQRLLSDLATLLRNSFIELHQITGSASEEG